MEVTTVWALSVRICKSISRWVLVCLALVAVPVAALESPVLSQPLVSAQAKPLQLGDYAGRLLVLNFIFTQCPSACPLQTQQLRKVQQGINANTAQQVQFVSISIDPRRDTPAVLMAYAKRLGVDFANWQFATGPEKGVAALSQAFDAAATTLAGSDIPDHKMRVFVLSPSQNILQVYAGAQFDVERVIADLNGFHQAYFPQNTAQPPSP